MHIKIRKQLRSLAEGNKKYAFFNKKVVNTRKEVLGARTPDVRALAKQTVAGGQGAEIGFLEICDKNVYDEVLLAGFMIGYSKLPDARKIKLTKQYLELVDSWGLIDSFVSTFKIRSSVIPAKAGIQVNCSNPWFQFAVKNLTSKREFFTRFGIIFLMCHFLDKDYIDEVFKNLRKVRHDGYYVKMGLAWFYATAAVKFYKQTLDELKSNLASGIIDDWTYKKSLQKMTESYRFTAKQKSQIRKLR